MALPCNQNRKTTNAFVVRLPQIIDSAASGREKRQMHLSFGFVPSNLVNRRGDGARGLPGNRHSYANLGLGEARPARNSHLACRPGNRIRHSVPHAAPRPIR